MSNILTVQSSDGEHGKKRHDASSPQRETMGKKNSFPKAKARTASNTPPTSPSKNSKDGSSKSNHKNSPWRNTMQRLRRRSKSHDKVSSPDKQEQAKHRSTTTPATTTATSSSQSVTTTTLLPSTDAVVRVPMRNRPATSPHEQQQQQEETLLGYQSPLPPPSLQYTHRTPQTTTTTNLYPSLNPTFSATALDRLVVQGTTTATSRTLSFGQSNLRNVNDHYCRNNTDNIGNAAGAGGTVPEKVVPTTMMPRDSVAVLRGNGVVAFAMVRTKSIIKRSSHHDGETKEGDGQSGTTLSSDRTTIQTTTPPRKSVSFDEASLAAQARDSRSTKLRQQPTFRTNVMLAMPVILPYLIAILILILSSLVPPADPKAAAAISRRNNNNNNNVQPSPPKGPVHQRGGSGGGGLARIFWYTKEPTPLIDVWVEDDDEKDASSWPWTDMWQNMLPQVTSKDARLPTSIKNDEEETPHTKGSGVWNFISFQVSTKSNTKQEPKPKTSIATTTRTSYPDSEESEKMQQRKNPIAVVWRRYFGKVIHRNEQ